MRYDVVIIGAGMSGLAAGIRLAYYEKSVCILERHYAYGGLNSYYNLGGRQYDVGLHALTNFVPPGVRQAPLPKVLRQLRISRDELDLHEQRFSEIRFPQHRLRFTNDVEVLVEEVAKTFPREVDGFRRLVSLIQEQKYEVKEGEDATARSVLSSYVTNPTLIEMLLCPIMYYGSPQEHDMPFSQFAILFRSILCEGFARPRDGVRVIIKALVRQFRRCGGKLRMRCGVRQINVRGDRAVSLTTDDGEEIEAEQVYSCAGSLETMRLCSDADEHPTTVKPGRMSFIESISILSTTAKDLGHEAAIVFFNDADRFTYARPDGLIDTTSGVFCCPGNYEGHDDMTEGVVRLTSMANYDRWAELSEDAYRQAKEACYHRAIDRVVKYVPEFRDRLIERDVFTPRTIRRFTGHDDGAVYGAQTKNPSGRTRLKNLFICGTDQGFLGIIGALLSGVLMANEHGLSQDQAKAYAP